MLGARIQCAVWEVRQVRSCGGGGETVGDDGEVAVLSRRAGFERWAAMRTWV